MLRIAATLAAGVAVVVAAIAFAAPRFLAAQRAPQPPASLKADVTWGPHARPAPAFSLRDQYNRVVSLSTLRGHVVALTFLDSHCRQLCPLAAGQLSAAQRDLGSSTPFLTVVVSVAPETDDPASIRAFAQKYEWSGSWYWLVGTRAQLQSVWSEYGIDVQPQNGTIAHSMALYVLDRRADERAAFVYTVDPPTLERDVRALT